MKVELELPVDPDINNEIELWGQGYKLVAGLDEAGRGALAGPVTAAAVILPEDVNIQQILLGVRDSKIMTALQRTKWSEVIRKISLDWSVGLASHIEIDTLGIIPAIHLAMKRALDGLKTAPQHLLIDALQLKETDIPQKGIIKGDRLCLSIAAASVLAKTYRDKIMVGLDARYPDYEFAHHKGYGTKKHRELMHSLGTCDIHRKSYNLKEDQEVEAEDLID